MPASVGTATVATNNSGKSYDQLLDQQDDVRESEMQREWRSARRESLTRYLADNGKELDAREKAAIKTELEQLK